MTWKSSVVFERKCSMCSSSFQVGSKSTTFHLTLELQHGNRVETVPVVVDRTKDGKFSLTHAGQPEEAGH